MQVDEIILLAQELAHSIVRFRRLEWKHGSCQELRQSEFILLATIMRCIGPDSRGIKISDLSTRLQITPAGVTHVINSLEEGGYVERLDDSTDRRVVLVKPTTRGKQVIKLMKTELFEHLKGLINFLGEQESKELIRLLSSMFSYIKERQSHDADKIKA